MPRTPSKSPRRQSVYRPILPGAGGAPPKDNRIFSDAAMANVDPKLQEQALESMKQALQGMRNVDIHERLYNIRRAVAKPRSRSPSPQSRSPSPRRRSPSPPFRKRSPSRRTPSPQPSLQQQQAWMNTLPIAPPKKATTLAGASMHILSKRNTRMREAASATVPVADRTNRSGIAIVILRPTTDGAFAVSALARFEDGHEVAFDQTIKLKESVQVATLARGLAKLLATKHILPK